jgi:hypothetical protein
VLPVQNELRVTYQFLIIEGAEHQALRFMTFSLALHLLNLLFAKGIFQKGAAPLNEFSLTGKPVAQMRGIILVKWTDIHICSP